MIDLSTLPTKSAVELREIAKLYNIPVHHKEGDAKLIAKITAAYNTITPSQPPSNDKPVFVRLVSTKEEIEAEARKYADKGLELRFPDDDTWHVRCKGAEDSGTIYQGLKVIARRIQEVARGARNPIGIKAGDKVLFSA